MVNPDRPINIPTRREGDSEAKPTRAPDSKREFKKMIGEKDEENRGGEKIDKKKEPKKDRGVEEDKGAEAEDEVGVDEKGRGEFEKDSKVKKDDKTKPKSIFDFSKEEKTKERVPTKGAKEALNDAEATQQTMKEAELKAKMPKEEPKPKLPKEGSIVSREVPKEVLSKGEKKAESKQGKVGEEGSREKSEYAALQGAVTSVEGRSGFGADSSNVSQAGAISDTALNLINKIVDEIVVVEVKGETKTTVTLNEPAMFQNAKLVISEFDSAKKELNISFENLTPEAQTLIEKNRGPLIETLKEKGYIVHTMETTQELTPTFIKTETSPREQQQGREGGRGGQQGGGEGGGEGRDQGKRR